MKKNFDFASVDQGLEVSSGSGAGFRSANYAEEGFRFRCALSDDDTEYARARK